jgi:hydrogenase maturation factor
VGIDNNVIALPSREVLILTCNPLSIIPSMGLEKSAWLTIHLLASDYTASGNKPQFAVLDFNLPKQLSENDFEDYLRALSGECKSLGISIVGGHTGKYPGTNFTIVGGGVLFGIAEKGSYVTPAMALEDDVIILTKGAAVEATAVLAFSHQAQIRNKLGSRMLSTAKKYWRKASTVREATIAASVGIKEEGVTAMHDATEGGVLGALHELSLASRRHVHADPSKIHVSQETMSICRLFGLDPLTTLSEGSLILTCRPDRVDELQRTLRRNSIPNYRIGEVGTKGKGTLWLKSGGTSPKRFVPPSSDPYWTVYERGASRA